MNLSDFELMGIVKYDFLLSDVTSMKTGGIAKIAFFPKGKNELREVMDYIKKESIKYIVIGNASNILFSDDGFDGAVIFTEKMKNTFALTKKDIDNLNVNASAGSFYIYAEAGVSLTAFSYKTLKDGFSGLEFAYGIPASLGGAIYMNAGAYGGEMSAVLYAAEYLDTDGNFKIYVNDKDEFSYRHSPFMNCPEKIIVGGIFKLKKSEDNSPLAEAEGNMAKRREKQPLEYPSCGSAFKRPKGHFAGALIEGAGLKGASVGGAYVSEKHAGFIINKGGATTSDVLGLIKRVQDTVFEKYGVMLEPEIRIVK